MATQVVWWVLTRHEVPARLGQERLLPIPEQASAKRCEDGIALPAGVRAVLCTIDAPALCESGPDAEQTTDWAAVAATPRRALGPRRHGIVGRVRPPRTGDTNPWG